LPGLGWSVDKQPEFSSLVRAAVSGQETRIALWAAPKWHFKLTYEILRADSAYQELQTLAGFFLQRYGQFDSFLYADPDDSVTAGQPLGTGDGTTKTFQLYRAFGGFIEPVRAPNLGASLTVYVDDVAADPAGYTVGAWGSATPGLITFTAAPAAGKLVKADFSYYFPVRFAADLAEFSQFMHQLWELKQIELVSVL
jgi:uncharacterized protein (TIGR02217 family)